MGVSSSVMNYPEALRLSKEKGISVDEAQRLVAKLQKYRELGKKQHSLWDPTGVANDKKERDKLSDELNRAGIDTGFAYSPYEDDLKDLEDRINYIESFLTSRQ